MKPFSFYSPGKIFFGEGSAFRVTDFLKEHCYHKLLVVTGKHVSKTASFESLIRVLEHTSFQIQIFTDTIPDPTVTSIDTAADFLKSYDADAVLAIGGGSCIDTAKAMCMLATNPGSVREYLFGGSRDVTVPPLPLLCIPTTAGSGSEVTAACVVTDEERNLKLSVTHPSLIPCCALVDPVMQLDMPAGITAATGMDALTHAIEAYTSKNSNPVSDMYAEKAISLIAASLRTAVWNPENITARENMALASTLAATAFVQAGLGAVHGIAQSMGAIAHTSHGVSNALLLPYVMDVNLPGCIEKYKNIGTLFHNTYNGMSDREGAKAGISAIKLLCRDIRLPKNLEQLHVTREMFDAIVEGTMNYRLLPLNPVTLTKEDVYRILEKAYKGGAPCYYDEI